MMAREELLVRTLVELTDFLVDDFDVIDVLACLSHRCVDLFDVSAAAVALAAPSGVLHVVASSDDTMRVLELFELQVDEGPCVESYRTGEASVDLDLSVVGGRWPRFAPRAVTDGFRSAHALPMRLRDRTIGALSMLRTDTGALDEADTLAARSLADLATIAILQHRAALDAPRLHDQLIQALDSRVIVEQAKGRISEAADVDMDQALAMLDHHARSHHLELTDLSLEVARGTVDAASLDPAPARSTT